MIGHLEVIDVRKQGLRPSIVFIFDLGAIRNDGWFAPEDMLQNGFLPEIHISPDDDIAKLDFRFLTRCIVAIITISKCRARTIYRAVKRIMPKSLTVSDGTFVHHEVFNG